MKPKLIEVQLPMTLTLYARTPLMTRNLFDELLQRD
jgi:hypothetical protein